MESIYTPNENRYAEMTYRRCGRSGILLPAISLGLWHNFGSVDVFNNFIKIAHTGLPILTWRIITGQSTVLQKKISAGF